MDRDPDRVSAPCWDGHHDHCTGWLVVPVGKTTRDASVACTCAACVHPPVERDRHLHDRPQPTSSRGG